VVQLLEQMEREKTPPGMGSTQNETSHNTQHEDYVMAFGLKHDTFDLATADPLEANLLRAALPANATDADTELGLSYIRDISFAARAALRAAHNNGTYNKMGPLAVNALMRKATAEARRVFYATFSGTGATRRGVENLLEAEANFAALAPFSAAGYEEAAKVIIAKAAQTKSKKGADRKTSAATSEKRNVGSGADADPDSSDTVIPDPFSTSNSNKYSRPIHRILRKTVLATRSGNTDNRVYAWYLKESVTFISRTIVTILSKTVRLHQEHKDEIPVAAHLVVELLCKPAKGKPHDFNVQVNINLYTILSKHIRTTDDLMDFVRQKLQSKADEKKAYRDRQLDKEIGISDGTLADADVFAKCLGHVEQPVSEEATRLAEKAKTRIAKIKQRAKKKYVENVSIGTGAVRYDGIILKLPTVPKKVLTAAKPSRAVSVKNMVSLSGPEDDAGESDVPDTTPGEAVFDVFSSTRGRKDYNRKAETRERLDAFSFICQRQDDPNASPPTDILAHHGSLDEETPAATPAARHARPAARHARLAAAERRNQNLKCQILRALHRVPVADLDQAVIETAGLILSAENQDALLTLLVIDRSADQQLCQAIIAAVPRARLETHFTKKPEDDAAAKPALDGEIKRLGRMSDITITDCRAHYINVLLEIVGGYRNRNNLLSALRTRALNKQGAFSPAVVRVSRLLTDEKGTKS
jgi:hypothetical protein